MVSSFEYRKQKKNEVKQLLRYLKDIQVSTKRLIWHQESYSCLESKRHYDARRSINHYGLCKNLFIRDKRGNNFWLVIVDYQKEVDLEALRKILDTSKLMLALNDNLKEVLKVESGSVSVFNVINDTEKRVCVIIDEELLKNDLLVFHPNYNGASVFIKTNEVIKFLERLNYSYSIVNVPPKQEMTKRLIGSN